MGSTSGATTGSHDPTCVPTGLKNYNLYRLQLARSYVAPRPQNHRDGGRRRQCTGVPSIAWLPMQQKSTSTQAVKLKAMQRMDPASPYQQQSSWRRIHGSLRRSSQRKCKRTQGRMFKTPHRSVTFVVPYRRYHHGLEHIMFVNKRSTDSPLTAEVDRSGLPWLKGADLSSWGMAPARGSRRPTSCASAYGAKRCCPERIQKRFGSRGVTERRGYEALPPLSTSSV